MVTNVLLVTRYSLFVTFYSLLIDLSYWYLSYIRTDISPSNPIAFENHWNKIGLYHKYFSGKFHWILRTPSNDVFTVSRIISRIEKNIGWLFVSCFCKNESPFRLMNFRLRTDLVSQNVSIKIDFEKEYDRILIAKSQLIILVFSVFIAKIFKMWFNFC